jgi:putative ABC transport system permease protein
MNLFQLVLKQMRQRALGTWLTMLSVLLGVGSAVAVLIVNAGSKSLVGQTDYGYDLIVGKGSPVQLVLNTVYHIDQSPGNIPYSLYEKYAGPRHPKAKIAVPISVGDVYKGKRIIATTPKMFGCDDEGNRIKPEDEGLAFHYRPGKRLDVGQGRVFHPRKFEAVIGSEIPKQTGLKLGDTFHATHGGTENSSTPDEHPEQWTVVGILAPTHTSNDRVLFIPLITDYCLDEHEEGMEDQAEIRAGRRPQFHPKDEPPPYTTNPDGTVEPTLPKEKWQISAILIKTRDFEVDGRKVSNPVGLKYEIDNSGLATAVMPAQVMGEFFNQILEVPSLIILLVCALVTVVAAVGILVSIYNSVSARKREIAILRALGATKGKVLTLICLEAGLIGLCGGVLGVLAGHLIGAVGSRYMSELLGQGFNWMAVTWQEFAYLGGVVLIAVLAGLVPAMKAYRTPVATNLVAA